MGRGILADSNCIIDYLDNKLPDNTIRLLETSPIEVSVINRMEILAWHLASQDQTNILQGFLNHCLIHSLSEEIILKTIEIRKGFRLKLPDAIIAATALIHNLTLFTRNLTDFNKVPGLAVINPHSL